MCALIEGGDLERRPRAGRRLLEDQRDLLAVEPLRLGAGVLGDLQRLGELQQEPQLLRLEVDLLEEASVAQVEHAVALHRVGETEPLFRPARNVTQRSDGSPPGAVRSCAEAEPGVDAMSDFEDTGAIDWLLLEGPGRR